MDYNEIRKLLEKYWAAETSVAEEIFLKHFFINHTDIPHDLLAEKQLFLTFYQESTLPELNEDLSGRFRDRLRKKVIPLSISILRFVSKPPRSNPM